MYIALKSSLACMTKPLFVAIWLVGAYTASDNGLSQILVWSHEINHNTIMAIHDELKSIASSMRWQPATFETTPVTAAG